MQHWIDDAFFYHIYPLGLCDAPRRNDFTSAPVPRLEKIYSWLDHIQNLGCNALYLGPLFESSVHGYDTADYYTLDRRLGSNETLARLGAEIKARGMRLVLDAVFNHVGRDFWAFRDVRARGQASPYVGWFANLRFEGGNRFGDPFTYEGWNGHDSLVKLNLANPEVRTHLFGAVQQWTEQYQIDGLRLDAADCLDFDFLHALRSFCNGLRADFWLMGEVIHGDYNRWANPETLHSVTNYEAYKGLYSSLAEKNYHEMAYTLEREFGPQGVYRGRRLYNFTDNHDVNRVASNLPRAALLYPLYILLFCMPGAPSLYYGSEWGLTGQRTRESDLMLRPALDLDTCIRSAPQPDLPAALKKLAALRRDLPALRGGSCRVLHASPEQMVVLREHAGQQAVVALNASGQPAQLSLQGVPLADGRLRDRLNPGERAEVRGGCLELALHPTWGRVLTA